MSQVSPQHAGDLMSATEEHYLKKLMIKNEIITEINSMSPEYGDTSGLRRFGPPFLPADPKNIMKSADPTTIDQIYEMSQLSIEVFRDQFPVLRFIFENYIVTFPFIKIHLKKLGSTMREQMSFWLKVQTLFELFKSKRISSSNDRGTTSKRNLMIYKVRGVLLSFFNSSIYAKRDMEYFQLDKEKRGAYKKLSKFMDNDETKHNDNDTNIKYDILKLSNLELIKYMDDVNDEAFVNGWYINIIGVTSERETKSNFWGSQDSKFYSFIIQVKSETDGPSWFIKKRYSEFITFYKELKKMHPGVKVPVPPSKDRNSVEFNQEDKTMKQDILQMENAEMDDFDGMDKESVDALFSTAPSLSDATSSPMSHASSSSSRGFLKSPKMFLKSTLGSGKDKSNNILSPLMNSNTRRRSSSASSVNSMDSADSLESADTFHSAVSGNNPHPVPKLSREILRQSLRAFLKFVYNNKTLADSSELSKFLTTSKINPTDLDYVDIQKRINIDNLRLVNHYKFQKALVDIVKVLEKDVESLKDKIYQSGFSYVFDRIREYETLHELCGYEDGNTNWLHSRDSNEDSTSPNSPLRGLVRIIMLEIASTQYELLIGSDSSMATLKTIKKLHYIFPYRVVAGVLRFTNPLMMVKRMIDVFTYQMPTVSGGINGMMQGLGMSGWKKDEKTAKNKSLLQILFSGMLGDDLKKLEKEKGEVSKLLSKLDGGDEIIEYINKYFVMNDNDVTIIKEQSERDDTEIFIAILKYFHLKDKILGKLKSDHTRFKNKEEVNEEGIYLLSKRYFHIQLRSYDKEIMIELWNEPEMMNVIKEIISLFLSPLIELFKKADVYKYVPVFAKYMTELLDICVKYSNDYGEYGRSDIVGELVGLEERYSEHVYQFIRDIYLNDIEDENGQLFEGIIQWMNSIIKFFSYVRRDRPDLKIDMADVLVNLSDSDKDRLMVLVHELMEASEKKRKLMEKMEEKDEKPTESVDLNNDWTKMERDFKVDQGWTQVHDRVLGLGASIIPDDSELMLMDNKSIVSVETNPGINSSRNGQQGSIPVAAVKSFRTKLREIFTQFTQVDS